MKPLFFIFFASSWCLSPHVYSIEALPDQGSQPKVLPEGLIQEIRPETRNQELNSPEKQRLYLGVVTSPIPEMLSMHLGVPANEGVIVSSVMQHSPASDAGLSPNDIITHIDGQMVSRKELLTEVIANKKAGESVELDLISKGQKLKKKIELKPTERKLRETLPQQKKLRGRFEHLSDDQLNQLRQAIEESMNQSKIPPLRSHSYQDEMESKRGLPYGEGDIIQDIRGQIEKMLRQGMPEEMSQQESAQDTKPGLGDAKFSQSSTVRFMDDEGSIEVQKSNHSSQVKVKDKSGAVIWQGPWDHEEQRAQVPSELRQRIEKVVSSMQDSALGNTFRLHFGGK